MSSSRSRYNDEAAQTALSTYTSDYESLDAMTEQEWNESKYHQIYSRYANLSVQELKWFMSMDRDIKPSPVMRELYGKMVQELSSVYAVLADEAFKPHLNKEHLDHCHDLFVRFNDEAKQFRPPTDAERFPDTRTATPGSDGDSDDSEYYTVVPKKRDNSKKIAKRKRQAEAKKIIHLDPDAPSEPSVEHTIVNIRDEAAFKPGSRKACLAFVPGYSARFLGGKRINAKDLASLSDNEKGKIVWKQVTEPAYVDLTSLNKGVIAKARADTLLPSDTASSLLSKGNNNTVVVKTFSKAEAMSHGFTLRDVQIAEVLYWKAQSELALDKASLSNKVPIVFAWFDNLLDLPDGINIGNVAKVFAKWLSRSARSDNPRSEVNNSIYSIKLSMFAIWPPGATRDDMLKRSEKSRKAAFGADYQVALDAFLATPAGKQLVRPKMPKVSSFQKAANNAAKTVMDKASAAVKTVTDAAEAIQDETRGITWTDTAKMYWNRYFAARPSPTEVPVKKRTLGDRFVGWFRKSVIETDPEKNVGEVTKQDRQWWRTFKAVYTAPAYAVSRYLFRRDPVKLATEASLNRAAVDQTGFALGWTAVAAITGLLASPFAIPHIVIGATAMVVFTAFDYS